MREPTIFEEYENATYEYVEHPRWTLKRCEEYASSAAWKSEDSDLLRVAVIDGADDVMRVYDWKSWKYGRQPTDDERRHFRSLAMGTGDAYYHPRFPSGHEKPEFHRNTLDPEGPYDVTEVHMPDTTYEELIDRLREAEENLAAIKDGWDTQDVVYFKTTVHNLCVALRDALAWKLEG